MMFFQAPPPEQMQDWLSTVTASAAVVSILQWAKSSKLVPFITQHSAGWNRALGWFAAFCTGTGIHFTFNHDAGVLQITGLSVGVIIHTATITSKQYFAQWLIYKGIVKEPAATQAAIQEGMPVAAVAPAGAVAAAQQNPQPVKP